MKKKESIIYNVGIRRRKNELEYMGDSLENCSMYKMQKRNIRGTFRKIV